MRQIDMIDDAFWLKFAKDRVSGAIAARDDAANKIDSFLNIVWPIYTMAFALGTAFNIISTSAAVRVVMALPVIILPIARYLCVAVQLPVETSFATNVIEKIRDEGYKKILKRKNERLMIAKAGAVIAVLSIALAVFVFKTGIGVKPPAGPGQFVKATYSKRYDEIHLEALVDSAKQVKVAIAATDSTGKKWTYLEMAAFSVNAAGRIDTFIASNGAHTNYRLYVSWVDNNKQAHLLRN